MQFSKMTNGIDFFLASDSKYIGKDEAWPIILDSIFGGQHTSVVIPAL